MLAHSSWQGGGALLRAERGVLPGRLPRQPEQEPGAVPVLPAGEGRGVRPGLQLHGHPPARHAQPHELPARDAPRGAPPPRRPHPLPQAGGVDRPGGHGAARGDALRDHAEEGAGGGGALGGVPRAGQSAGPHRASGAGRHGAHVHLLHREVPQGCLHGAQPLRKLAEVYRGIQHLLHDASGVHGGVSAADAARGGVPQVGLLAAADVLRRQGHRLHPRRPRRQAAARQPRGRRRRAPRDGGLPLPVQARAVSVPELPGAVGVRVAPLHHHKRPGGGHRQRPHPRPRRLDLPPQGAPTPRDVPPAHRKPKEPVTSAALPRAQAGLARGAGRRGEMRPRPRRVGVHGVPADDAGPAAAAQHGHRHLPAAPRRAAQHLLLQPARRAQPEGGSGGAATGR
mmetsp:Transcript_27743/g.60647  ORF Transcript_27743/g.60647 Transcript_27743/m.60647 type:complete len:397 (+) Transcript_27743:67-1257(+)